jgi:hypothetical protein
MELQVQQMNYGRHLECVPAPVCADGQLRMAEVVIQGKGSAWHVVIDSYISHGDNDGNRLFADESILSKPELVMWAITNPLAK